MKGKPLRKFLVTVSVAAIVAGCQQLSNEGRSRAEIEAIHARHMKDFRAYTKDREREKRSRARAAVAASPASANPPVVKVPIVENPPEEDLDVVEDPTPEVQSDFAPVPRPKPVPRPAPPLAPAPRSEPETPPEESGRYYGYHTETGEPVYERSEPNEEGNQYFTYQDGEERDVALEDTYLDPEPRDDPDNQEEDIGRYYGTHEETGETVYERSEPNDEGHQYYIIDEDGNQRDVALEDTYLDPEDPPSETDE